MTALLRQVTLNDKYLFDTGEVYLTGIQALVRLALDRVRLDQKNGLKTGGFISGYRGSPLGGFDQQLGIVQALLNRYHITFQPGLNEELGATAVWGSQKVGLHGSTSYEGVFGLWYGKGPGVDRSTDAFKHANASGTAKYGGVLALAGDDHLAKSSTLPFQSEFAFIDCEIPIFNPSDLQEVLDYGLFALSASRFSGLWTAMICLADTMDSSGIIDVSLDRHRFHPAQDISEPREKRELNKAMKLAMRLETEFLTRQIKIPAFQAVVRAHKMDGLVFGSRHPRFVLLTTGKAYRDVMQTFELLGINEEIAKNLGLGVYKAAVSWPLEPLHLRSVVTGVEKVLCVEHKRAVMEPQLKDILYHMSSGLRPEIWGKFDKLGNPLLPDVKDLSPIEIAPALLAFLPEPLLTEAMRVGAERLVKQMMFAGGHGTDAKRSPFFCSGCPHNLSTQVPDGSRALAGIGCHTMTEIVERTTDGLSQMGGEGISWLGQFPFSNDKHVFVNLGDGTYFHSGILALRAAVSSRASMTYKILYNDAVAMTGGQHVDGVLTVPMITQQVAAEGIKTIVVVTDDPQKYLARSDLAFGVKVFDRSELLQVERDLQKVQGVSVLIFDQTCAAEKRRRRKRGLMTDPDTRIFINPRVCEGCGDCSVQSNCISIEPLDTPFGEKRKINQSSCNKDTSCTRGFCPSFVRVSGGRLRKFHLPFDLDVLITTLSPASVAKVDRGCNVLITGIGGLGVTTTAAVMAMAAHLDGIRALTLDMTGLAQKGGPVSSHVRFAAADQVIQGSRIPVASTDLLLASDLLVAAGTETLALLSAERTQVVANTHVAPSATFTMKQSINYDPHRLQQIVRDTALTFDGSDAAHLMERVMGDAIYTNMFLVGVACQKGLLPLSCQAIEMATQLNGASVAENIKAFRMGRIWAVRPDLFSSVLPALPQAVSLEAHLSFLSNELVAYQNHAYAARFMDIVERAKIADAACNNDEKLVWAVADNLYKLMAYKDEYEVARLYSSTDFIQRLQETFSGELKLSVDLAPPFLARRETASRRPEKITFGSWIFTLFHFLAKFKFLRGTAFDLFGYSDERKTERAVLQDYILLLQKLFMIVTKNNYDDAVQLAQTPQLIKGYGVVKEKSLQGYALKVKLLREKLGI